MGILSSKDLGFNLPEGVTGIDGTKDIIILKEKPNIVICFCDTTNLIVELIISGNNEIEGFKCKSKGEDGKCKNPKGPRNDNLELTKCCVE